MGWPACSLPFQFAGDEIDGEVDGSPGARAESPCPIVGDEMRVVPQSGRCRLPSALSRDERARAFRHRRIERKSFGGLPTRTNGRVYTTMLRSDTSFGTLPAITFETDERTAPARIDLPDPPNAHHANRTDGSTSVTVASFGNSCHAIQKRVPHTPGRRPGLCGGKLVRRR